MLSYEEIKNFKDNLINYEKKEKEIKSKYYENKENLDSLDELLTLAKKEICKEKSYICPVCRSEFDNMQVLINRLDLSVQQQILSSIKEDWDRNKIMLEEAQNNYENKCNDIREKLESMIYKNKQYIIDLKNKIAEYKIEIENNEIYFQQLKEKNKK